MSFKDEIKYTVSLATLWKCRRCLALVEIPTTTPFVTLNEAIAPNARLRIHECDTRTGAHGVLEIIGTPPLKEPEAPEPKTAEPGKRLVGASRNG